MGHPPVEEEKNILFQGIGVPCDDEEDLRNSWFIILPISNKYLGIFEASTDIPRFVESGCTESDLLGMTYTFVGSSLYIIGSRVPNDLELSDSIRWLDTRSSSKQWRFHDEDTNLKTREGYIWDTRVNECFKTRIPPPQVAVGERQWRRIRACAPLEGKGLLIAMDGEENNFFLYNSEINDCGPEQFRVEVQGQSPLYQLLDTFQKQREDNASAEEMERSLISGEPSRDQAEDIGFPKGGERKRERTQHEDLLPPQKYRQSKVTRSISDDDLKPAVTPEPEIMETVLSAEDEFLGTSEEELLIPSSFGGFLTQTVSYASK
ncbi:hypothetical protein SLEP1_g49999 [Rubroshorea leprosula]|uniref:PPM-type phosphatase domain-containing protein n=1 Tax=Rubroshorea leprosula TaxID=152421 RepID=A0AAV5LYV9_9ROSI|nr:hypothetical protein SLEP1_g49999 [Rubroshorea leprosula]